MSTPNCMDLAKRVSDSSKLICSLLESRIPIDAHMLTICDSLGSPTLAGPNEFYSSMDVEEQNAHFSRLDAIGKKIEACARLSQPNAKTKRNPVSRSTTINSSRENLSTGNSQSDETVCMIAQPEPALAVLTRSEIRKFNDQNFGSNIDVGRICERDKQSLRPIFKHVPKLKEFIGQIEAAANQKADNSEEADPKITNLLERLYEIIVDVTYLEDHENIYGRNDIEPYDDLIQTCLEQLYKQIMNQET